MTCEFKPTGCVGWLSHSCKERLIFHWFTLCTVELWQYAGKRWMISMVTCSCVSSWGPRLEWRCDCLHGADDVEDQGGCKGQKMTSDPSAPLCSAPRLASRRGRRQVWEAYTCSHRVLGHCPGEGMVEQSGRSLRELNVVITSCIWEQDRKAIGAKINSVFICLYFISE